MTTYEVERADQRIRTIGKKEYIEFVFNFTGSIESSDTLSAISGNDPQGQALGVSEASSTLTIGTPAINSGAITVDKRTVAVTKAVTCFIGAANATIGTVYEVVCRAKTTTGQTKEIIGRIRCE